MSPIPPVSEKLHEEAPPQYIPPQTRTPEVVVVPQPVIVQQPAVVQQPAKVAALPLQALNLSPAPVDCPICGTRAYTRTSYEVGSSTQ
jgi:hypothetical protein